MYVPGPNAVDDPAVVLDLLRSAGVGHLVSGDSAGALASTVLPFVIDDEMTTMRAHFARANPHWRTLDGADALMIVPVVDGYVSPSWYPSKHDDPRVVPTWNYEVVHVHATVHVRDDPAFVESVVRALTELNETRRVIDSPTPPTWSVDDAPAAFIAKQLRAIVGVELTIDRVEAKRKLSQNKSAQDRAGVVTGLRSSGTRRGGAVADTMEP
jgi:transcriptional regulator